MNNNMDSNSVNLASNKYPVYLKHSLDKFVVGQERYKEKIAMSVYKHICHKVRNPILVIGPSGCGKTHLMMTLKNSNLLPEDYSVMIYDYSRQTPAGITGDDISSMLQQWKTQCRAEHNTRMRGVIFIDEVDKIIMPNIVNGGENMNAATQYQLMNAIAGTEICGVDTSEILFVLGGAFVMLDEYEGKKHNPIGFIDTGVDNEANETESLRDKLIEIGAVRELMGRITSIVRIEALNEYELMALLLHPVNGVIAQKKKEFEKEGLTLEVESDTYDILINRVLKENLGARSLMNILDSTLDGSEFYALEHDYQKIRITKDTLNGKMPVYERLNNEYPDKSVSNISALKKEGGDATPLKQKSEKSRLAPERKSA